MITFKATGFSHVMSTGQHLYSKLSTYACNQIFIFITKFSFLYAYKFQESQISFIYQKLNLHSI